MWVFLAVFSLLFCFTVSFLLSPVLFLSSFSRKGWINQMYTSCQALKNQIFPDKLVDTLTQLTGKQIFSFYSSGDRNWLQFDAVFNSWLIYQLYKVILSLVLVHCYCEWSFFFFTCQVVQVSLISLEFNLCLPQQSILLIFLSLTVVLIVIHLRYSGLFFGSPATFLRKLMCLWKINPIYSHCYQTCGILHDELFHFPPLSKFNLGLIYS